MFGKEDTIVESLVERFCILAVFFILAGDIEFGGYNFRVFIVKMYRVSCL